MGVYLMAEQEQTRYIVRIMNTDLNGNKHIVNALRKIKGVNFMFANAACNLAGVNPAIKAGDLTDAQIKALDDVLTKAYENVPVWMLNRRKDYESGVDKHLFSSDIKFVKENDVKRLKKIKAYRGYRHALGLPVRGQRTRSNFRKNKGKVAGVIKKKVGQPPAPVKK